MPERSNDPYGLSAILESVEAGALDDATSEQRKQVVRKLVAVAQEQVCKVHELKAQFQEQAQRVAAAEKQVNQAVEVAGASAEAVTAIADVAADDSDSGGDGTLH